jgi:uncharacterized protein YlaI
MIDTFCTFDKEHEYCHVVFDCDQLNNIDIEQKQNDSNYFHSYLEQLCVERFNFNSNARVKRQHTTMSSTNEQSNVQRITIVRL